MMLRRPVLRLRPACAMGAGTEKYTPAADGIAREPPGRVRRRRPTSGPPRAIKDGLLRRRDRRRSRSRSARATRSLVDDDEGVRPGTTAESLGELRPAFDKPTAPSPPATPAQISDGGAAVIVMSEGRGRARSASRRSARSSATARWPAPTPRCSPSRRAPSQAARPRPASGVGDVDLFELNEAFAAVGLASMDDLGITDDVVNVNGGAIALGHPIGMSGTRVALTLLHELSAAAAASAPPPSAAAAARATRCWSRPVGASLTL